MTDEERRELDPNKTLWLAVRQACLLIADAIAKRYDLKQRGDK